MLPIITHDAIMCDMYGLFLCIYDYMTAVAALCHNQSGCRVLCHFKEYLKIDINEETTIRIIVRYLIQLPSNVAFAERSILGGTNNYPTVQESSSGKENDGQN